MTESEIELKRKEQIMSNHQYDNEIERITCKLMNIDSDQYAELNLENEKPYESIKYALMYCYAIHKDKYMAIKDFFIKFHIASDMDCPTILSYVLKDEIRNGYQIGDNGVDFLNNMISEFEKIVD